MAGEPCTPIVSTLLLRVPLSKAASVLYSIYSTLEHCTRQDGDEEVEEDEGEGRRGDEEEEQDGAGKKREC